jgi:pimeloyl-ACP methyl ester carboxylesterase
MKQFSCLNGDIAGVKWGKGRKALAFHGFLDNAMSFYSLSQCCLDLEIWSIDLPGHGLSSKLPACEGTFILSWIPLLGRLLDELDWDEYIIIGHSLGAIVAQQLAAVDSRISMLFCLDALGPIPSSDEENIERFSRVYQARNKSFPVRYYSSYQALVESRQQGIFPLSPNAASIMAKRAVGYHQKGWFHQYDRQLRQESLWRMSESNVKHWLERIHCPVKLAVFSAHQWPAYAKVWQQRIDSVQTILVDEFVGSHHLHMEEPEKIARWISQRLLEGSP